MGATNYTSLREMLEEALEANGETVNDVEAVSNAFLMDKPIQCDGTGEPLALASGLKGELYAWTTNHVCLIRLPLCGGSEVEVMPRNPVPGSGWVRGNVFPL